MPPTTASATPVQYCSTLSRSFHAGVRVFETNARQLTDGSRDVDGVRPKSGDVNGRLEGDESADKCWPMGASTSARARERNALNDVGVKQKDGVSVGVDGCICSGGEDILLDATSTAVDGATQSDFPQGATIAAKDGV